MHTFDESRMHLAASAVGIARAAFEYAVEYARSRNAFGKPIGQHQAVGFRLADMATRIDAARLLTHRAARLMDEGKHAPKEAAQAKLFASETATWVHLGGAADARRLGLLPRVPDREVGARRPPGGARGRHLRHPAADHQPRPAARLEAYSQPGTVWTTAPWDSVSSTRASG